MDKPIVTVRPGRVQGIGVESVLGSSYIAFYEIPYGIPPIGERRFKDPEPPLLWMSIKDCTVPTGKICIQAGESPPYKVIGSEDCLYLNVYTKSVSQSKPVMFWIHGNGFTSGNAGFDAARPDYLLEKDVVVVTANYRLGAFGFLNLDHRAAPGNIGLKDLIAALEWVKDNIANFGGDPKNVTIFGQNTGGVLAHALTLSPKAEGLFHKAIIQSGTITSSWATKQSRSARGRKLASLLGINAIDPEEIIEKMRKLPAKEIVKMQNRILTKQEAAMFDLPFGINCDEVAVNPVLPLPLHYLWAHDSAVPIMAGYTSAESIMFFNDNKKEAVDNYNRNLPEYTKLLSGFKDLTPAENDDLLKDVKNRYFDGQAISRDKVDSFLRLMTDIYIGIPTKLFIEDRVKRTSMYTYFYRFKYVGNEKSLTELRSKRLVNEATNGDELPYLFYLPSCKADNPEPPAVGTKDRVVMERMTTMWTNFAKTGHPALRRNDLIKTAWKVAAKKELNILEIGEECELIVTEPHVLTTKEKFTITAESNEEIINTSE